MKPIIYKNVKKGLYLIDEYGNIYSNYKKDFIKSRPDKNGYLHIKLSGGSRENRCDVRIATLVAYHFIGDPPEGMKDPTVNHIDGNILNNHYSNLEWLERKTNSSIRKNIAAEESNGTSKLTKEQVLKISDLLINSNLSYQTIADRFNVKKSTIANIKQKKNWRNVTKDFDFNNRQVTRDENGKFEVVNINLESTGIK